MKRRPNSPGLVRAARYLLRVAQLHEQDDGRILVVIPNEAYNLLTNALAAHDQDAATHAKKPYHRKDTHQEHP